MTKYRIEHKEPMTHKELKAFFNEDHAEKLARYQLLLGMTYDQAIAYLLDYHGSATEPYFKEKSYNRFLAGEIKTISKGKVTRTNEGLYCHHIDENRFANIANPQWIKANNVPFEVQKADRLVFSDLWEHLILHVLIVRETQNDPATQHLGRGGVCLIWDIVDEWYLQDQKPFLEWAKKCYWRAFLPKRSMNKLLADMKDTLALSLKIREQERIEVRAFLMETLGDLIEKEGR